MLPVFTKRNKSANVKINYDKVHYYVDYFILTDAEYESTSLLYSVTVIQPSNEDDHAKTDDKQKEKGSHNKDEDKKNKKVQCAGEMVSIYK